MPPRRDRDGRFRLSLSLSTSWRKASRMSRTTELIEWYAVENRRILTAQFAERFTQQENKMAAIQDQLNALTDAVDAGIAELRTEIARLAALPAGEEVDFSHLQALADALATDNVPAAPAEEPAPAE